MSSHDIIVDNVEATSVEGKNYEISKENAENKLTNEKDLEALAYSAAEQSEEFVNKLCHVGWNVCHYNELPRWLQDNEFLLYWHRPPLPSFRVCFKSIFRLHTETGNIWTHLLGFVAFICVACYFFSQPSVDVEFKEKLIFGAFFVGAIICLGFSFTYHTLTCHSIEIGKLFSKLDYCGIALLIMGSFVPWLYYGFYCHNHLKIIYLSIVCVLGCAAIIVSLWDKFSEPKFRPLRAGVFLCFGVSGIIPLVHYGVMEGFSAQISKSSLGWFLLMGIFYISGALLYAFRIPERWFPGKCDLWFQSHQIFHVLVVAAAFVQYHSISQISIMYRATKVECISVPNETSTSF
ncbi:adiponectin receptor protein-like [Musca autumnalis]|uniref:adiponectin receptor protein-like n=1 Tax=Musca autumnalis TaxID=221902 RepID=UPI003CF3C131